MDQQEIFNWSIVYTDHSNKYIHLDYLQKSNPTAQILCADTSNEFDRRFAWRNGDLLLRKWLKNNYDKIINQNVAILEWDVLVSIQLPQIKINGLYAKEVKTLDIFPKWPWFKEVDLLNQYKQYAIGVAPLGVLFIEKPLLEIIMDSEFDELYNKDIFSELRLPTILNSRNITISEYNLPNVFWDKTIFNKDNKGIYHPIKNLI